MRAIVQVYQIGQKEEIQYFFIVSTGQVLGLREVFVDFSVVLNELLACRLIGDLHAQDPAEFIGPLEPESSPDNAGYDEVTQLGASGFWRFFGKAFQFVVEIGKGVKRRLAERIHHHLVEDVFRFGKMVNFAQALIVALDRREPLLGGKGEGRGDDLLHFFVFAGQRG